MNHAIRFGAIIVALAASPACGGDSDTGSTGAGASGAAAAAGNGSGPSGGPSGTTGTSGNSNGSNGATGGGGKPGSSSGAGGGGPAPGPIGSEPLEGFGATSPGGDGGKEIHVTEPTDAAVRAAFKEAAAGNAIVIFDVAGPIVIDSPLPLLDGAFITIEGNGTMLDGSAIAATAAMIDVRGHDVIVQHIRLRNSGDNLRAQGDGAYNVVFNHVSSTGAADDGISIGYGAHDVTVQYSFLAGNTRSIFIKYNGVTNVTIHHSWIMKYWIRGPIVNGAFADLRNNIVEDWTLWGTRFEEAGHGNAVSSIWRLSPYAKSLGGKDNSTVYAYMGADPQSIYVADAAYEGNAVASTTLANAAAQEFPAPPVTTQSVGQVAAIVEPSAGCLPRDAIDQAYIAASSGWDVSDGNPYRDP